MLHATRDEKTMLYTGDFKLRESLTAGPPAAPLPTDELVMECTYGKPIFRFPPWRAVADRLMELVEAAFREGRQPIVMGYSLGKAQEITRLLTDGGFAVTLHGAPWTMHNAYAELGVSLGKARRYVIGDFHGRKAMDLRERGVLVAPPNVARAPFATRFKNPCTIVMTGWAILPDAIYRYGVNHALPLSDHADFDELLELIERVRPGKIYTHHGFREFAQTPRDRGHDATPARPDEQLSLFGE